MASTAATSLTPGERRVLERAVELLREEFGADLRSVWLYGSAARGEQRHDESDVDLLVVLSRDSWQDTDRAFAVLTDAAEAEGEKSAYFSMRIYTPERLAQRREIRSFFIQEVDREKIILYGEP
jgi:predicted nucleotidyltransferase